MQFCACQNKKSVIKSACADSNKRDKVSGSSSRPRTPAFHAGNTGSNPVPDAKRLHHSDGAFFNLMTTHGGNTARQMDRQA